jgi:hypothetical protein
VNLILDKLKQYPFAVVCGGLLLVCMSVLLLRGGLLSELTEREAELSARIRTVDGNAKNSKGLEQQVEALEAYVEAIDTRLFDSRQRAINTNFFYSFEDRVNVLISSVSQLSAQAPALSKGGPNALKLHASILYEITLKGTFKEILGFIYEMYRVDPLIRVSDFEVHQADSTDAAVAALVAKLRVVVLARKN